MTFSKVLIPWHRFLSPQNALIVFRRFVTPVEKRG
jgi:hypothetical protein